MYNHSIEKLHPLLQKVIIRIVKSGIGDVIITEDGHLFVETCEAIESLRGALDMKKEGKNYGVRVVVRQAKKRSKRSKYKDLPMIQLYVLPVVKKIVATMTDAERQNIELNRQTLTLLHAVERNPEQLAYFQRLFIELDGHMGSKKYNGFYGFLYAMCRKQAEQELAAKKVEQKVEMNAREESVVACRYIPLLGTNVIQPRGIHFKALRRRHRKYLPRAA